MVSQFGELNSKPVLVWGAGAIGGTIGAALSRSGIRVQMVDLNEEHCRICSDVGLQISGPVENYIQRVPCVMPNMLSGQYNTVILAVKAHHTAEAAQYLMPHLSGDGFVLSAQNGLNENILQNILGFERVMGCFVNYGADWINPGQVLYGNRGAVVLGEIDGSIRDRTRRMHELIKHFEPDAIMTSNIMGYLWGKMCYGSMLFATALTGDSMAKNFGDPKRVSILAEIGKEVIATAFAEGVRPEGFNGFQPLAFSPTASRAETKKCMMRLAEFNSRSAKTHSGIHRDLAVRKRTTEVDHQPGLVAQIAHRHGIPTPKLNRLVELIHDIENGRRKMSADVFFLLDG